MSSTRAAPSALVTVPRTRIALAAVLGALTVLFGVGLMALAGYLISRAAERPAILSLTVVIVGVRFFGLGRPILRYLDRIASHDLALRGLGAVRTRFLANIEPLAPGQLASYREGDLLSRMVADVDSLQNLYLRGLGPVLVAVLAGTVSVGVAVAVLPVAGIVLAAGLLVEGIAVPALGGVLGARARGREAGARGALAAELVSLLRGAPELLVFGAQSDGLDRVRIADARLVRVAHRDALAAGAADGLGLVITGATVCGVLVVAAAASTGGEIDRTLIALLALLALASFEAVTPLAGAARELSATLAARRRIYELTAQRALVQDPASPADPPSWPFAIAFEAVSARYPGHAHNAVEGFSLRIDPGEHVAILGASGAGKTTLANLLLRFLDPAEGRVTIAGRDLRDYRQADIRRAITLAGQESHLFSASIRDNVALARPEASDVEVEQALRRACIWDWVAGLPAGPDTPVGELGHELSGGQRQRIVLARALMTDAPVLILDEPTAHLDPATATELVRDVLGAARDKTVLLITHRSEGLELVDRVETVAVPSEMRAGGSPR